MRTGDEKRSLPKTIATKSLACESLASKLDLRLAKSKQRRSVVPWQFAASRLYSCDLFPFQFVSLARAPLRMPTAANLYDYPRYYDLVFGSDWKAEFDFLLAVFDTFAGGRVRRVFEPACGTGRLLFRLAQAGFLASGLDLNPRAVEFCNKRLARHGHQPAAFVGDMSDFALPRPIDAAFNTINSFRHLLSEDEARNHLRCVAAALRKGGVYVLGLHLTPTEGEPLDEERWSARRGHLVINTHLKTFDLDLRRRTERCRMVLDVHTPNQSRQIVDELVFRTYTAPQLTRLLDSAPELKHVETYDFRYRIDAPTEVAEDTQDVVLILKKT
jgi:SAM-dependent methyltransferase